MATMVPPTTGPMIVTGAGAIGVGVTRAGVTGAGVTGAGVTGAGVMGAVGTSTPVWIEWKEKGRGKRRR